MANVAPADTSRMVHKYLNGDTEGAMRLQLAMKPLIDALFCEVNPIPVKAAMKIIGYDCGECRLPLTELSNDKMELIKKMLTQ